MKNQRQMAFEILEGILYEDKRLEDYTSQLNKYNNQESGFIRTLVMGSLRYKIQLDYFIGQLSNKSINKIDKDILLILELSLYQILYMDHIPERAVIYEAVELTKRVSNFWSSKFVNGILRNFLRKKEELLDSIKKKKDKELASIEYSYPLWMIDKIEEVYGIEYTRALKTYNQEIDLVIRYNPMKVSKKEFLKLLSSRGYEYREVENLSTALVIDNPQGIFNEDFYKKGYFYAQSISSQLVARTCEKYLFPEIKILDLCSAPGGKTGHLYELSNGSAEILAADINQYKLNIVDSNMKRLGHNIQTSINDATLLNEEYLDTYDLVLLDAPCSAIGLLRRFPEIKTNLKEENIEALADIQYRMLENAIYYVKRDGILLYSTCSFTLEENQKLVDKLLEEHRNLDLLEKHILKPWEIDSDGFSIFLLKRR